MPRIILITHQRTHSILNTSQTINVTRMEIPVAFSKAQTDRKMVENTTVKRIPVVTLKSAVGTWCRKRFTTDLDEIKAR